MFHMRYVVAKELGMWEQRCRYYNITRGGQGVHRFRDVGFGRRHEFSQVSR